MGKALQVLGYKVCGSLKEGKDYEEAAVGFKEYVFQKGKPLLAKYDAFQDTPWFIFYEELYRSYPDAYFILTTRNADAWLNSVQKHFGTQDFLYHRWIYNSLDSFKDRELYLERFNNHNQAIRKFFKENDKFLEFSIENDGWDELVGFLGQRKPWSKFPHSNKASHRASLISKIKTKLKKWYYN